MYKTIAATAAGTMFLLGIASTSYAADTATKQPLDQSIESVDKNLAKDPDNKGLQNAAERLQTNKERQAKKREAQAAKREAKSLKKAERKAAKESERQEAGRPDKAERPEKTERPEKVERPEAMGRPVR